MENDPNISEQPFYEQGVSQLPPFDENSEPEEYNPFTDEDSPYFGLSPDWRPTGGRPIPTQRCYKVKSNGEPCKNRAIRGSGLTNYGESGSSKAVCFAHGGRLPNLKKHAEAIVDAARIQLTDSTPDAVRVIMEIMKSSSTASNVRLAAAKEVLDRAGVKSGADMSIEITNNILPSEKIMKKLQAMRADKDEEPLLEDLGEAIVEEPEQGK